MSVQSSNVGSNSSDVDETTSNKEKPSFKYSFAYERATLYEYKFERQAEPDEVDPCLRCNKTVPPEDDKRILVGSNKLFHKQCFRCRICGMPLTQQTFFCNPNSNNNNNNNNNGNLDKEVYCKTHVGKKPGEIKGATITETTVIDEANASPNSKYIIQVCNVFKKFLNQFIYLSLFKTDYVLPLGFCPY